MSPGCDCINSDHRILTPPKRPPQAKRESNCAPCPKVVCQKYYMKKRCPDPTTKHCNATELETYVRKLRKLKVEILPNQIDPSYIVDKAINNRYIFSAIIPSLGLMIYYNSFVCNYFVIIYIAVCWYMYVKPTQILSQILAKYIWPYSSGGECKLGYQN